MTLPALVIEVLKAQPTPPQGAGGRGVCWERRRLHSGFLASWLLCVQSRDWAGAVFHCPALRAHTAGPGWSPAAAPWAWRSALAVGRRSCVSPRAARRVSGSAWLALGPPVPTSGAPLLSPPFFPEAPLVRTS